MYVVKMKRWNIVKLDMLVIKDANFDEIPTLFKTNTEIQST